MKSSRLITRFSDFIVSDIPGWFSGRDATALCPTPSADSGLPMVADEAASPKNFRAGFNTLPASAPVHFAALAGAPGPAVKRPQAPEAGPLPQFHVWAPAHLAAAKYSCGRLSRARGKVPPRDWLKDLRGQISVLVEQAGSPELLPVRQLAGALEGLLKHLGERTDDFTPSTLRTVEGAIDLLIGLCAPGLAPDLATNPPIRLLGVDDDAVSRYAMASALKRAFDQPDLAENAEGALALAVQHPYDVIFLDVRMPGMDGFELCKKIHETAGNRATPVIFVTGMKDFDSQVASIASGGSDLIGKPFLTFEIAVKALTFAFRRRLGVRHPAGDGALPAAASAADGAATVDGQARTRHLDGVIAYASASVGEIRDRLQTLNRAGDENERWKILAAMYLCLQALSHKLNLPGLRPAHQVCAAVEGLLRKLQENPKLAGPPALQTVLTALDLLQDLCVAGVEAGLAARPPIGILVVDDDPLTCRMISLALQTAFVKPAVADNGGTAAALCAEKPFDVIFMDVQMPVMDGFAACAKIRESTPNRATPVVFVTSHADAKSFERSALAGGNDFVTKPFMPVEITVKALTYALRNRLGKFQPAGKPHA
jgi:CheY-like chemotaxis protein